MRRRNVLKKVGTASTITLAAFSGSAAASSSSAERTHFVTTDEDGQRVVVPLDEVDQEDVATSDYCVENCSPHCCSQCAPDCNERCDGCICADPGC